MSKLFLIPILFLFHTLNSQDLILYPLSTSNSILVNSNGDVVDYSILAKNNSKDTMQISELYCASSMYFYTFNYNIKIPPNDCFLIHGTTARRYADFIKKPISFFIHYSLISNDTILKSSVVHYYKVDSNLLFERQNVNNLNTNDFFKNTLHVSLVNLYSDYGKSKGLLIGFKDGHDTINFKIDSIVVNNKRISDEIYLNNIHSKLLRFYFSSSGATNYVIEFYYRDRKNKRRFYKTCLNRKD